MPIPASAVPSSAEVPRDLTEQWTDEDPSDLHTARWIEAVSNGASIQSQLHTELATSLCSDRQ